MGAPAWVNERAFRVSAPLSYKLAYSVYEIEAILTTYERGYRINVEICRDAAKTNERCLYDIGGTYLHDGEVLVTAIHPDVHGHCQCFGQLPICAVGAVSTSNCSKIKSTHTQHHPSPPSESVSVAHPPISTKNGT
jgi:hypothetical protein